MPNAFVNSKAKDILSPFLAHSEIAQHQSIGQIQWWQSYTY